MGLASDVILFILLIFFNVLGAVMAIAILAMVGKVVLSVSIELLKFVWKTIHKPSFDKFKSRPKKEKVKDKVKK